MTISDIAALWTLGFTVIGVGIAVWGIRYAVKSLKAVVEEAKANAKVARAQCWIMVRSLLANYDDIHANLRPDGIWAPKTGEPYASKGPQNAAEWARVELFMGMFEYCEKLLCRDLLEPDDFEKSYKYRLGNLLSNAPIVAEKLHLNEKSWKDFYKLCERFKLSIPSPEDLSKFRSLYRTASF